jgi:uncharacterized protein (TIGR00730 family)
MHSTFLKELTNIDQISECTGTAVSIFGSARMPPDSEAFRIAFRIAGGLSNEGYTVISGGGPGIMRAANQGAKSGKTKTWGFNIVLPFEKSDMRFQDVSLEFENFCTRKLAFVKCSSAFILMPGGMGTLDELFEVLTLLQTGRIASTPVVLVGAEFWGGLLEWMRDKLAGGALIGKEELQQIKVFDDAQSVCAYIKDRVPLNAGAHHAVRSADHALGLNISK